MSRPFVVESEESPSTTMEFHAHAESCPMTVASSGLNEPNARASGHGTKIVHEQRPEARAFGSLNSRPEILGPLSASGMRWWACTSSSINAEARGSGPWTTLVAALVVLLATATAFGEIQTGSATSPAAEMTATASKSTVQVAEPFTLEVHVTAHAGTHVSFPAVGDQFGEFEVIGHRDRFDIPSASSADQRGWTRILTLESIITGDLEIPSVEIRVSGESGSRTLRSEPTSVTVASVLEGRADPTQFRDIQSVVDVNVPQSPEGSSLWWIVAGVGGCTVLAAAAMLYVSKRRTWMTPRDWAQQQLDAVASSAAIETGDSEAALQDASSILREFVELQFDVSAPVQTTDEFLQVVKADGLVSADLMRRFGRFFAMADQAKFAGLQLSSADLDGALNQAFQLVNDAAAEASATSPAGMEAG